MTDVGRMSVQELLGKVLADEHADVLRQAVVWLAQELMEAEVSQVAGAAYGERHPDRVARRNGYHQRAWDTRVGSIELAIPRLRSGSYFPSFLEPRRRSEQALVAVVQEAYVNGVSTRKVDRLVEALGLAGASKDQVSRLCQGLDEQVQAFREWPLESAYPYLWLDAKVEKVRAGGRVEHRALVVAYRRSHHAPAPCNDRGWRIGVLAGSTAAMLTTSRNRSGQPCRSSPRPCPTPQTRRYCRRRPASGAA
jgi:putative transposase